MTTDRALWIAVDPDELPLPERLDAAGREKLAREFDPSLADSALARALARLALRPARPGAWLSFANVGATEGAADGRARVRWDTLVETVSAGWLTAEAAPDERAGYRVVPRKRDWRALPRLLRSQWRLERVLDADEDGGAADPIELSIALALAAIALTLRLPRHDEPTLARWLAEPARAPAAARATVRRLQAVQARRTRLSPEWDRLFGAREASRGETAPAEAEDVSTLQSNAVEWSAQGLPVCPGRVTAPVAWEGPAPGHVIVFARARPETVERFAGAVGVIFLEGGVLSHACVVAREQGLPAITALGRAHAAAIRAALSPNSSPKAKLSVSLDAAEGQARFFFRAE